MQIALGNAEGSSCAQAMREAHTDGAALASAAASSNGRPRWTGSTKSKQVTWEHVDSVDPDILIICGCGLDLERNTRDTLPTLRNHAVASRLRAVREGRVFAMDGNRTLSRPGPCLVEGTAAVAACLWYGDAPRRAALEATGCLPEEGAVWGQLSVDAGPQE